MKKVLAVLLVMVLALGACAAVAEGSDYTELSKGDKGDAVVKLQERLNELGYPVGSVDGDYGGKTEAAVRLFQTDHGLSATGIADPATQEALFINESSVNHTVTPDSGTVPINNALILSSSDYCSYISGLSDGVPGVWTGYTELDDSTWMQTLISSVDITSASDLMATDDTRACLAAFLIMDFASISTDFGYDFSKPMYVANKGDNLTAVAFGCQAGYVMAFCEINPLSTGYSIFYGEMSSSDMESILKDSSTAVWDVSYVKFSTVITQIEQIIS